MKVRAGEIHGSVGKGKTDNVQDPGGKGEPTTEVVL